MQCYYGYYGDAVRVTVTKTAQYPHWLKRKQCVSTDVDKEPCALVPTAWYPSVKKGCMFLCSLLPIVQCYYGYYGDAVRVTVTKTAQYPHWLKRKQCVSTDVDKEPCALVPTAWYPSVKKGCMFLCSLLPIVQCYYGYYGDAVRVTVTKTDPRQDNYNFILL